MIKARTADAFFVKVDRAVNACEKTNAVAAARAAVLAFMVAEKIPDEGTAIVEMTACAARTRKPQLCGSAWPKLQLTLKQFCTSPSVTRQLDSRSSLARATGGSPAHTLVPGDRRGDSARQR